MGLRTIIDSRARVSKSLVFRTGKARPRTCFLGLGANVFVHIEGPMELSKTGADVLKASDRPLIVYDSGGAGEYLAEEWVAENEGIIIASALAALAWFEVEGKGKKERDEAKKEVA